MSIPVLEAIRSRRTVIRYDSAAVKDEEISMILEAGRWAPSWLNKQPWSFTVVRNQITKNELGDVVPTAFVQGLKEAPVCIVVSVDTDQDPFHYVEDGAAATQNMSLVAHSLGLQSAWIGVYDLKADNKSPESRVRQILGLPKTHRIIAVLPVGHGKYEAPKKDRKSLERIVYHEKFGNP